MTNHIKLNLTIPENLAIHSISGKDGASLYHFIKENKLKKTLEIGFANGRSAAYIISSTQSKHIVIDPFQKKEYDNVGLKNIEDLGLSQYLQFENDFSHNVLPRLHSGGEKIDFAFIDGDHRFDYTLLDFFYLDLLLEEGGYVIFDDIWMGSVQWVASFIETNRKDYKKIHLSIPNMVGFQKLREDYRLWAHFREFGTDIKLSTKLINLYDVIFVNLCTIFSNTRIFAKLMAFRSPDRVSSKE